MNYNELITYLQSKPEDYQNHFINRMVDKLTSTFQGKTVTAFEIGTQVNYPVAHYNSKSGRTITPLRSL